MATFFGVFCPDGDAAGLKAVQEMTAAVKGEAVMANHYTDKAFFGYQAWAIDEPGLPLWSTCGSFLLTGYLRIDYREDLAAHLGIDRGQTALYTNGQLLLMAYQKWGQNCVSYLYGDWAFAIYDKNKNTLFFARDQLGVSALFYTTYNNRIYFTSDLNLFKAISDLPLQVNKEELLRFSLRFIGMGAGATFFEGVHKLEHSHCLSFNAQRQSQKIKYWELMDIPELRYQTDDQYAEQFHEIFERAVQTRMPKQTQTGILLSSGYDSTAVAAFAAAHLRKDKKQLYSFTSVPAYLSEIPDHIKFKTNEQPLVEEFASGIPNLVTSFGGFKDTCISDMLLSEGNCDLNHPLIIPNTIWLDGFFQQAKEKGIGLMLNGQQGNVFISWNGPYLHSALFLQCKWQSLFKEIGAISKNQQVSRYTAFKWHVYGAIKAKAISARERILGLKKYSLVSSGPLNDRYLRDLDWERFEKETHWIPGFSSPKSSRNVRQSLLKFSLNTTNYRWHALAQRHQIGIADATSDIKLANFSFGVPENLWYKEGVKRFLYRKTFTKEIPTSILNSPHRWQSADYAIRIAKDVRLQSIINEILADRQPNEWVDKAKLRTALIAFNKETNTLAKNKLGGIIVNNISFYLFTKKILP
jgi:asparagine synthase (glutamine-hydrolysing)